MMLWPHKCELAFSFNDMCCTQYVLQHYSFLLVEHITALFRVSILCHACSNNHAGMKLDLQRLLHFLFIDIYFLIIAMSREKIQIYIHSVSQMHQQKQISYKFTKAIRYMC